MRTVKKIACTVAMGAFLLVLVQICGMLIYQVDLAGWIWGMVSGQQTKEDPLVPAPENAEYPYVEQRMGYEQLPGEAEQLLYQQIAQGISKIQTEPNEEGLYPIEEIVYEGRLQEASLQLVISTFRNENPEVFWLANRYRYAYGSDVTTLSLYSYVSPERYTTMQRNLNRIRDEIFRQMPNGLSELDREIYLFESLSKRCTYDTETASGEENWKAYTLYGALVDGKAVCEGYSRAMQSLLGCTGMESILVNGTSKGMNHMWNLVKVDGDWYHLDATWGDGDEMMNYQYFNVTDDRITRDHVIYGSYENLDLETASAEDLQNTNLRLPVCSATAANYFLAKGIPIKTLHDKTNPQLVDAIAEAAKSKKESVSVYIDESLDFENALDGLFSKTPYLVSHCMGAASRKSGVELEAKRSVFVSDPISRGITIKLLYVDAEK